MEFEPGTPGTEITELPSKPQGSWRVQLIEKAICLWFLFFYMDWWTKCFSGQQEVEEHLVILDELEKREGAGTFFVQPIITRPVNNLQKCSAPDTSRKCTWRQCEDSFDPGKHGRQGTALLQVWYLYKNWWSEKPRRIVCMFSKTWWKNWIDLRPRPLIY